MSGKLILALLAPWISGVALGWPAWLILLSGMAPWALADWLARNTDFASIKQAFTALLLIEAAVCVAASIWIARRKVIGRIHWTKHSLLFASFLPAAFTAIALCMRGTIVEFPTDSFVYYHTNFAQEQLVSKAAPGLTYDSSQNWYYSTQYFLYNLQNLTISTASRIASLNSFTAIFISANITWQLTKRWELGWLTCLFFLISFGHQSLSFFHQLSLNGTLIGISLVLAASLPLLESINHKRIGTKSLLGHTALLLGIGLLAYKAHPVTGYFTLNILAATWLSACFAIKPSRIHRIATAAVATIGLAALSKKDFDPNLKPVFEYPEYMRIVHSREINGLVMHWFWPALPNSTLEITFIAATGLAITSLWIRLRNFSSLANSTVALSILPFLVFGEWLIPGINNLTFKLISPEVAYRIAWTSLFWISIPVMLMEINKALSGRHDQFEQWLKAGTLALVSILAIPIHLGTKSNILNSKVPHLLSPLEAASMADGSSVEPILKKLNFICNQDERLKQGYLLSDPFIGAVLRRSSCAYPLAGLDYTKNSVESAEKGFYTGLNQNINKSESLKQWLVERRVNVIVLRDQYPEYYSEIGMNSRFWQPDLVSGYRGLTLNKLNETLLKQAGFSKQLEQHNLLIFARNFNGQ